ncbi:MAG: tRNA (adenosine(37)-N6)-threonylcarbamoyltransferase complex dimerization subunit type 1 TsaB [Elusimicrobiota bacterium]
MIIVGIDTTTKYCEVSMVNGNDADYICVNLGNVHSEILIGIIRNLLERNKLAMEEVDGLAVNIGPGSFTGIRVGIACCRAWAQARNIKIAPVAGLDALAHNALKIRPDLTAVCSVIDALRNEVYLAVYINNKGLLEKKIDYCIADADKMQAVLDEYAVKENEFVFFGNGIDVVKKQDLLYINKRRVHFIEESGDKYLETIIAQMGKDIFDKSKEQDYGKIIPLYLRRSEAEVKWEEKNKRCQ